MGDGLLPSGRRFGKSYEPPSYTYGMEDGDPPMPMNDMYDWYRRMGVLCPSNSKLLAARGRPGTPSTPHSAVRRVLEVARDAAPHSRTPPSPVLTVGGAMYDQEDIFGPHSTYAAFLSAMTRFSGVNRNRIVCWARGNHGGWL
jgi:hypothetical protein